MSLGGCHNYGTQFSMLTVDGPVVVPNLTAFCPPSPLYSAREEGEQGLVGLLHYTRQPVLIELPTLGTVPLILKTLMNINTEKLLTITGKSTRSAHSGLSLHFLLTISVIYICMYLLIYFYWCTVCCFNLLWDILDISFPLFYKGKTMWEKFIFVCGIGLTLFLPDCIKCGLGLDTRVCAYLEPERPGDVCCYPQFCGRRI